MWHLQGREGCDRIGRGGSHDHTPEKSQGLIKKKKHKNELKEQMFIYLYYLYY